MTSGGHKVDTRWTLGGRKVDIGEGPNSKTNALHHLFNWPRLQIVAGLKLLVLTSKKLIFKLSAYIFDIGLSPPTSTSHPLT